MSTTRQHGFSLVEIAVVLIVLTVLSAGAISALRTQTQRAQFAEARNLIDETREALLNYAAVTGALPCPDTSSDGTAGIPGSCGSTGVLHGFVPWKALGIARSDPWGQSLRYAVHVKFTNAATVTLIAESGLSIQRIPAVGAAEELGNSASVVMAVWSTGPDAQSGTSGSPASTVVAEAPGSDDIVSWLSRFVLIGRMLEAGRDVPQGSVP